MGETHKQRLDKGIFRTDMDMGTWIENFRTYVAELGTDHAKNKLAVDQVNTAVAELMTDHAKNKLAVDQMRTVVLELMTDHATVKDLLAEVKTLTNNIRSTVKGDYTVIAPGLTTGSTSPNVASLDFDYIINGKGYNKAAVAAGTALSGSGSVPQSTYGAFALQIGSDGTIDVVEAAANSTGYASSASALADLPAVAADHARLGTVTVYNTAGVFTPGTTNIDAAGVTSAYADAQTAFEAISAAISGSAPATLAAASPTAGPATLSASTPTAGPVTLTASLPTSLASLS